MVYLFGSSLFCLAKRGAMDESLFYGVKYFQNNLKDKWVKVLS